MNVSKVFIRESVVLLGFVFVYIGLTLLLEPIGYFPRNLIKDFFIFIYALYIVRRLFKFLIWSRKERKGKPDSFTGGNGI